MIAVIQKRIEGHAEKASRRDSTRSQSARGDGADADPPAADQRWQRRPKGSTKPVPIPSFPPPPG